MALSVTDVETAITAIESGGQSFTIPGGLTYTSANLSELIKLRDALKAETSRSDGTRPVFRGFSFTGMGY